ncbi:hypothetical protein QVD17_34964 [Tagetes erecta]|uniref:Uncharacterized protein n=1 Tax=Tagetes erecta TaxID=13708 RepID=A0AAD8NM55_TARER|nr:hypothetical protein QVD17_34964 [Tagetes erecta]
MKYRAHKGIGLGFKVSSPLYDENVETVVSKIDLSQRIMAETSEFSWEDRIKALQITEARTKVDDFAQSYYELEEVKDQFETIVENKHAFMADISPTEEILYRNFSESIKFVSSSMTLGCVSEIEIDSEPGKGESMNDMDVNKSNIFDLCADSIVVDNSTSEDNPVQTSLKLLKS